MLHRLFITIVILLVCFTFNSLAQKPSRQNEMGIVPGIPFASSDIENVNLTNGNLNFSFPLGSLPTGRGQAAAGMFLKYNSKLWQQKIEELLDDEQTTSRQYVIKHNPESGWKYGEKYTLRVVNRNEGLNEGVQQCTNNIRNYDAIYDWKVQIEFPDGSLREFRPTNHSIPNDLPSPGVSGTFYNIHPNVTIRNFATYCDVATTQDPNPFRIYHSVDGSFMRLTVYNNLEWELQMSDGSKITYLNGEQKIYDRNGNFVRFGTVTLPDNTQAIGWIDQFNRYTVKKATSATEDTVYQLGINGQILETKVRWKQVTAIKKYRTKCADCGETGHHSSYQYAYYLARVVDNVQTPQGLVYTFDYYAHNGVVTDFNNLSSGWGEVKSITLPSQAKTEYQYGDRDINSVDLNTTIISEMLGRMVEKNVFYNDEYDGITTPRQAKWIYTSNSGGGSVTNPDGTISTQYCYDAESDTEIGNELGGFVYKEMSNNGAISEKLWSFNNTSNTESFREINPFVKAEFNTIPNASGNPYLTAIKEFNYDKNGNVTQVKEYDWVAYSSIPRTDGRVTGLPSGLTPIRVSSTTFNNPTPDASDQNNNANGYWNPSAIAVKNAVASVEIKNGSGTVVSRSEVVYDNPNTTANPIQSKVWDSSKGAYSNPLNTNNSISTSTQYNQYGMPILTTDAKGVQTQITYGQVGSATDLYPTQVISALGTPQQRTATTTYDFSTGLPKTSTDVDNGVTNETVYDAIGRPTINKVAINTANEAWTQTEYNDQLRRVVVRADLFDKGDGKKVAIQHFDQLGRVRLSRTLEDATTQNPYNEADGIKVQIRYAYDTGTSPNGTFALQSNPYRTGNESEMGWTVQYADKTGKTSTVKTYSGGALPAPWGSNANLTGTVLSQVDANTTLVTDQAGRQRRSISNGLGQLVRVDEPDDNGNLGSFGSPTQPTAYTYDTLNNLVQVNQGVQQRNFTYNSLSRLLTATNPESGTIGYAYDNNGNLTQKTDARGVVTNYVYDNINRITSRNYTDGTPNVTYTYDNPNIPFSKGRLTQVASAISTTNYTQFDNLGRVLSSQQITDGQQDPFNFAYSYNLSGALVNQTYPSGRIVTNNFETDGDLAQVNGSFQGQSKTYVGNFNRTSAGAVSSLQLGNGLWENRVYNTRLQPIQIGLGTNATDQSLWKVSYEFGELQSNGTVDSSKNNGNVGRQMIIVPSNAGSQGFTATQAYSYDSLDRLKQAKEIVGSQTTWQQTYLYDRFSNRRFDSTQTSTLNGQLPPQITNPIINESNNRFRQEDSYSYDLSGNLTQDASGNRFNYEADGKTSKFFKPSNNTSQADAIYYYDGEGKRVKKVVGDITTIFVFDANGKTVAEYTNENINPTPTTTYTTHDDYDNPRIMSDANGQIKQRRDYMPFGEELLAGYGSRTEALGYTEANVVRQGFAGKDKDSETGFNYFGERYYSSSVGRFTSPDTLMASGGAFNPQTWNRYAYVVNNPIAYIDINGQIRRDKNGKVITSNPISDKYDHPSGVKSSGNFVTIKTDKGTSITAFQNSVFSDEGADTRLEYNCHGLTFTQGQLLIENDQVQKILKDDYEEVNIKKGEKPQVGDVVVYYSNDSESYPSTEGIVHSTTVVATNEDVSQTQVAGLGGIQQRSTTSLIGNGWQNVSGRGSVSYRIFRRRPNNEVEPNAQQRANIAQNANKSQLITTKKAKIEKKIQLRPLEPLPKPPKKKND